MTSPWRMGTSLKCELCYRIAFVRTGDLRFYSMYADNLYDDDDDDDDNDNDDLMYTT